MFERAHHQRIAQVLAALDAPLLAGAECWFGGGTAIALRFGEYRESVDIDFLISNRDGYRQLRQALTATQGITAICRADQPALEQVREVRADQYGIRTMLRVDAVEIKVEIVLEGRIAFEPAGPADALCGVQTLTPRDLIASKLLANSDRWHDDAVLSRDLIDLAMIAPGKPLLQQAITKAEAAYGASIRADLAKAVEQLRERPKRLHHCMQAMGMTTTPQALLWERIRTLARRAT